MEDVQNLNKRNSSVELFKIIGILLIVIGHQREVFYGTSIYIWASRIYGVLPLGHIGNMMFLVPSLWFFCDSDVVKKEKVIWMCFDCAILCLIFLLVYLLNVGFDNIDMRVFFYHFPPMSILYYWYIVFYIALYIFHPVLNTFFKVNAPLLGTASIISIIFLLLNTFFEYTLNNCFVSAICYYIIVMYLKYNKKLLAANKISIIVVLSCFFMMVSNYLFNKINSFSDNYIKNLFSFIFVFALYESYVVNISFYNPFINLLSRQSLNIFVIHESLLLKNILRPKLVDMLCKNGMPYILIFIVDCIFVLFASYLISLLYNYLKKKFIVLLAHQSAV